MHTILNLESNGSVAEYDETFEERLGETGTSSFFVHDDWTELLVITDENDLFASEDERNHTFCAREKKSIER